MNRVIHSFFKSQNGAHHFLLCWMFFPNPKEKLMGVGALTIPLVEDVSTNASSMAIWSFPDFWQYFIVLSIVSKWIDHHYYTSTCKVDFNIRSRLKIGNCGLLTLTWTGISIKWNSELRGLLLLNFSLVSMFSVNLITSGDFCMSIISLVICIHSYTMLVLPVLIL